MKCMSATFPDRARARVQGGFAAVAGIFVLVVLAGVGIVLITVFGAQQRSSAFDWLGMQAYQSARAGIDLGVVRALAGNCPGNSNVAMPNTLSAFNVNITCAATAHVEGGDNVSTFEITATACNRAVCPANADDTYVERQLRATVASIAP